MTVTTGGLAAGMRARATSLLSAMDGEQRGRAAFAFGDEAARRWLEYRPEPRPGACLTGLGPVARKAACRLLASALSQPAFAQAMTITALEEVLDEPERRTLVLAVRGASPVGHHDDCRRCRVARAGLPRG